MEPVRLAAGVRHVVIGGEIALEKGTQTEARPGRFLLKQDEG